MYKKTVRLDLKFLNFETTGYFTMMSHHDQMKNFCQTFAKLNWSLMKEKTEKKEECFPINTMMWHETL